MKLQYNYNVSKPVESFTQIKKEVEDLEVFITAGDFGKSPFTPYAIHHAQVTDDHFNFFVLNRDPVIIHPDLMEYLQSHVIINPRVKGYEEDSLREVKEGCMSFPYRQPKLVKRYLQILVEYEIPDGEGLKKVEKMLQGSFAQIFQHEIGHGEGKNIYFKK